MFITTTLLLAQALSGQTAMGTASQTNTAEAQSLQAEGKYDQAREFYERSLSLNPGDADAQRGMSSTSERLALDERAAGHMDSALADLVRAQKVLPDDERVLLDLGIIEEEMGLYIDGARTLEHLVSLKPADPNAFYALARVDLDLGRLDAAEQEMKTYLNARPLDASAHYGLGRIYLQGLEFEKAEKEFDTSISIQPKQTEAYYQLGQTELDENRFEESIVQFQKALDRSPEHGGALVGMGMAFFKLKHYDKAKDWLVKATVAAPEYQPGHYYLGLTLARLGDVKASRKELEIATSLAANDSKQSATRLRLFNPDGQP
jgi:tetratricopeptide (TPR) repeat protein